MTICGIPFRHVAGAGYTPAGAIWLDGSADQLERSIGAPTNEDVLFIGMWIKRAGLGTEQALAEAYDGATYQQIWRFDQSTHADQLTYCQTGTHYQATAAKFRDPNAWMHVGMQYDNGDVTLYVNGAEITALDADTSIGAVACRLNQSGNTLYLFAQGTNNGSRFSGYAADVVILDGEVEGTDFDITALCTTDDNGNPIPVNPGAGAIDFSGANSAWLDFANSADLGNDVSGNGNDFTLTSVSSANATNDNPADNAAGDVGNYATWNPLNTSKNISGGYTLSTGNRYFGSTSPSTIDAIGSTLIIPTDDVWWYWEHTVHSPDTNYPLISVGNYLNLRAIDNYRPGAATGAAGVGTSVTPDGYYAGGSDTENALGASYQATTDGDVQQFRFNGSTGELQLDVNNTGTYTTVTTLGDNGPWIVATGSGDTNYGTINFGQVDFAYAPEAGDKLLNTANLPAPTVTDPSLYFNTVLYTGNAATQSISGVGFQPDLVWIKSRSNASSHELVDAVRGATKELWTDSTSAETTDAGGLTSFDADGFSLGSSAGANGSARTFAAWCLKAGGASTTTNTDGDIPSEVSTGDCFSILTYTGNGSTPQTVGHGGFGASAAPEMMIIKSTSGAYDWIVYHKDIGATNFLYLNQAVAKVTTSGAWNDTAPTGSVFTVSNSNLNNANAATYVGYMFRSLDGVCHVGSYTGNGNADGPYVHLGFRPAFLLWKTADTAVRDWWITDSKRSTYNAVSGAELNPNDASAEGGGMTHDYTANGFKVRNSSENINKSGDTFIYLAFAENPFGGEDISQARAR